MGPRTILLVEDNPKDEALALRALKKSAITNQVIVTRDGAEALEYLFGTGAYAGRGCVGLPAVVLLDLSLPQDGGLEALVQIRANKKTKLLPVVILTSSDEERDRLKGYENGANSYVRKPVEFNAFAEAIRQLGLYWLILNEPLPPNREMASTHDA